MTQGTLKIALFGATGMIGSRIAAEAARRGHQVTALSRNPAASGANVQAKAADLFDPASIAAALEGQDVVASAYGPKQEEASKVVAVAKALVDGARKAGVKRVVVVGGAGTLEVAPGKQLVDTEGFSGCVQGRRARAPRRVRLPVDRAGPRLDVLLARRADRARRAYRPVPHRRGQADRRRARQQQDLRRRLCDRVRRRDRARPFHPASRDGGVLIVARDAARHAAAWRKPGMGAARPRGSARRAARDRLKTPGPGAWPARPEVLSTHLTHFAGRLD